ncbi:hypothetical protein SDC9_163497 [bioreactor metagenome]|uniref:Uncharacterized protein n=1 Tax=bioreactor metagenome TaxID=1076179 RepID=A0A645FRW3_9ZZZZ
MGATGVALDALAPTPALELATTLKLYAVPLVRPVMVHEVAGMSGGVAEVLHVPAT